MVRAPWIGRSWSIRRYQLCLDVETEPQSGHTGCGSAVTSIVHPFSVGIQAWIVSPFFDRWRALLVIILNWDDRAAHQKREHQIRIRAQVGKLTTTGHARQRLPSCDRLFGKPDRQAATSAQGRIILGPVRHPTALLWNVVTMPGIGFERHNQKP